MYIVFADPRKLEANLYEELKEKGLALQYPFELDQFQQQAVHVTSIVYVLCISSSSMYVCMYGIN